MAESPATRPIPCWTTSPRAFCASSTRATSPCRRFAPCTTATARARSSLSNMVSGCRRRLTIVRCCSRSLSSASGRRFSSPQRPVLMKSAMHPRLWSRLSARPGCLTPKSSSAKRPVRWMTSWAKSTKSWRKKQRVLVTTLTKRMAESLTEYLQSMDIRVRYLHSDVTTMDRMALIRGLRLGEYDVLVGINLLREGLDLPEVSLVAILDADKEGFLRSETSLVQTIGRAARNVDGRVIMYADVMTDSLMRAISETNRRRAIQEEYNRVHGITPESVRNAVHQVLEITKKAEESAPAAMSEDERNALMKQVEDQMLSAAKALDFEQAAKLRDQLLELKGKSPRRSRFKRSGEGHAKAPDTTKFGSVTKPGSPKRVKGQCPLQGAGTASLLGFGATPQLLHGRPLKRKIQAWQPWSQAAKRPCAVTLRVRRRAPKPLFPTTVLCRAKWARPPRMPPVKTSRLFSQIAHSSLLIIPEVSHAHQTFSPPAAPALRAADGVSVPRRPPWRAGFRPRAAQRGGAAVMRPNRADSALSQYFCSLLTAALLLVSLLCGLIFFATTRTFAASVLSSSEKRKSAQNRVERRADSGGFCPLRRCACPPVRRLRGVSSGTCGLLARFLPHRRGGTARRSRPP